MDFNGIKVTNRKNNLKIAFSLLGIFIISIMILYFVSDWYLLNYETLHSNFYLNLENVDENRIFLIGSSHVGTINQTNVQQILFKNGKNFHVYNLQESADHPVDRLKWIDKIIDSKPDLVVYGIDIRNFRTLNEDVKSPQISPFPSIQQITVKIQEIFTENYFLSTSKIPISNFENPKLITLKIFDDKIKLFANDQKKINDTLAKKKDYTKTLSLEELTDLKNKRPEKDLWGFIDKNNENVFAIKHIVKQFQNNNMPIILFVTPQHEFYYKSISYNDMQNFQFILDDIAKETDLTVYDFHEKYWDLNVWMDLEHVALGTEIYDNDVTDLILKELEG